MTDNVAILASYTKEYEGDSYSHSLHILVRPGTDMDGTFKAWCMDEQEWVKVKGWMFTFEVV